MKDVQATLRRIDKEITGHNQLIARSRVEIARLQETRNVLMNLADEDVIAAHMSKEERQNVINGAHAKPLLVVRRMGSEELAGRAQANMEGLNKSGDRRGMNNPKGKKFGDGGGRKGRFSKNSAVGKMRVRIAEALKDATEPMTGSELGNYLGLPADADVRKPLQNALYSMRVGGQLHRDAEYRYSMAAPPAGPPQ